MWEIPGNLLTGDDYRIRIFQEDPVFIEDLSDNYFSIYHKDDIFAAWDGYGVWLHASETEKWQQLTSHDAVQVTAGDFDGDGKDDLIGWWDSLGIWVQYSDDGSWEKIFNSDNLLWLGSGDMNGDGMADIIGSWNIGVWCRDSKTGTWNRIHKTPAQMVAAGDFDHDGMDGAVAQ